MLKLNPLDHPICLIPPDRLTRGSSWHGHVPFAMFLVDLLRPRIIVELGTQYGDSYCAFCQAVKELNIDTACYAVDTWRGDPHVGSYGANVLADLRAHHDPLYGSFSRLIQSTFDEALEHFSDGTVDLLHIDGYHTYESVKHDFESWLSKMSPHGLVLFHDTNVRERDFGVRKFWEELRSQYPHFEFLHGSGLGILAVGELRSEELRELFQLPEEERIRIRNFFFNLGHQLTTKLKDEAKASQLKEQATQLQELKEDLESKKDVHIPRLEKGLQQKASHIADLEASLEQKASQVAKLETDLAEKVAEITSLKTNLQEKTAHVADLESSLEERSSQIAELESSLEEKASRIARLEQELSRRESDTGKLRRRVTNLEAERAAVYSSYSWRITTPLRTGYHGLQWMLRSVRRASILIGWLFTGQFRRAGNALLRYYVSSVPLRIRAMVPIRLRHAVMRWLTAPQCGELFNAKSRHEDEGLTWFQDSLSNTTVSRLPGVLSKNPGSPTILVCAHNAGGQLYGAEWSLLDVLDGFVSCRYNVVAVLPGAENPRYISELISRSMEVVAFSYPWWRASQTVRQATVAVFEALIDRYCIDAVHVNTIMLREPLMAARRKSIPAVVHAREVISHDEALCRQIGACPDSIIKEVVANADYIIANSKTTAACYDTKGRTIVLPNSIDIDEFDIGNDIDASQVFVGLISSNIVKKGIFEFAAVAERLKDTSPNLRFLLIGEQNHHVAAIRRAQKHHGRHSNLDIVGYIQSPIDAVSKVNIVVNLSHFQESFGRTVLEAMAARRPVVAYDWGAIPELIVHGETGYLVPYRDVDRTALCLERLAQEPSLITKMGEAARDVAVHGYAKQRFAETLREVYTQIIGDSRRDSLSRLPPSFQRTQVCDVSVIVPNYNYAHYLPERLVSIINQTVTPREIIFLDDASSDNSIEVARHILEQSSIPFTIIRNETNAGTYQQWLRGIAEANGEFIWIAEADDICEPDTLATLAAAMQDGRVVIAYCQSKRIDENGIVTAPDNLHHTNELDPERWRKNYRELGVREVVDYLVYRNTMPNASACLLRRSAIGDIEKELSRARFCGDRLLYAHLLRHGDVSYIARPLNSFRRHSGTVTASLGKTIEYLEEVVSVKKYMCESFPIHPSQLPRMVHFLDKDYKVEGVNENSQCPAVRATLAAIAAQVTQNRRFGFITTNNASFDGGSEVLWRECARRLRGLGHDVVILIRKWDPPPPYLDDFAELGIKPYFKEEEGFERIVGLEPDLVVVSIGDQDEGIEYYGDLRRRGIPYVVINQLTKEPRFWPIRKGCKDKVRDGYTGAERVFFTCENNHRVMEQRLRCELPRWARHYNPCHTNPNAVLPFPSVSQGINLAVPAKILLVHKGQDLIVEVMKQGKWKERDVTIDFYGVGADEERLKEMVNKAGLGDKFVFHGKIAFIGREHEIPQIWLHNQAILLPSRMEGLPIMLVSAMLSARVPIVTNIGGHAEVIEDGVTGFIASDPTPEALDDAMERAYQRRHEWEEIGRRAKQAMLNYLPQDPVGDAVNNILEVVRLEAAHGA